MAKDSHRIAPLSTASFVKQLAGDDARWRRSYRAPSMNGRKKSSEILANNILKFLKPRGKAPHLNM
jgi:hypothetical protein